MSPYFGTEWCCWTQTPPHSYDNESPSTPILPPFNSMGWCSCHIYLPNKSTYITYHQSSSPYEKLYQHPSAYETLCTRGCLCFPNLTLLAPNKLAPRSFECFFIVYPPHYKGYRCLNLQNNKVIISRHVVFHETMFPLKPEITSNTTPHNTHPPNQPLLLVSASMTSQVTQPLSSRFPTAAPMSYHVPFEPYNAGCTFPNPNCTKSDPRSPLSSSFHANTLQSWHS